MNGLPRPCPGPCEFGWLVDGFWGLLLLLYFIFYCPVAGEWPTLLGTSLMIIFALPAAVLLAVLVWFSPPPGNDVAKGRVARG